LPQGQQLPAGAGAPDPFHPRPPAPVREQSAYPGQVTGAWGALSAEPAHRTSRYANARLADGRTAEPWPPDRVIRARDLLLLHVDIGPLSGSSQVSRPAPFPDDRLPGGDLAIDVVVSSTSFTVGRDPGPGLSQPPAGRAAADRFVLPGSGGPARAADGGTVLTFTLEAPAEPGPARLRIAYYYRDAVVQSQLLTADVGPPAAEPEPAPGAPSPERGPWLLTTDYTVATALADAARIPDRPRVAVLLNGNDAAHEIYVRARSGDAGDTPGAGATAAPATAATTASAASAATAAIATTVATAASLPAGLADGVRNLRRVLSSDAIAPTAVARNRAQLIATLRALAPLGWDLCAAVFPSLREVIYRLAADTPEVLHVARPAGVTLSVPWAFLYTISIDSSYGPGFQSVPVCPLVSDWDGRSPLVTGDVTACPRADAVSHASDLLCPFGFLGFRHDIEQLSSTERPVVAISAAPGSSVVVAEARQVNQNALRQHVSRLQAAIARLPGVTVDEATDKARLRELISRDLPLIYFLCHGERPTAGSPETYLAIGNREWLTPADFAGWVQAAFLTRQTRIWDKVRPLVFINACHSAELDPAALFNYIDAFVGGANAAGVIGTEVKVSQDLAMRFAQSFFDALLAPGATVAVALRRARLDFLAQGNVFGLNYTPYCWADLALTGGPAQPAGTAARTA
jgi:hypothetical protein